jgi:hypothetical protein
LALFKNTGRSKTGQETLPSGMRLLMLYLHCRFQL